MHCGVIVTRWRHPSAASVALPGRRWPAKNAKLNLELAGDAENVGWVPEGLSGARYEVRLG